MQVHLKSTAAPYVHVCFVTEPWHWKYCSTINYFTAGKGLTDLIILHRVANAGINNDGQQVIELRLLES